MEEIDYITIPDWLKKAIIEALKTAGKAAAVHLCKKYIADSVGCDIAVAAIAKALFG